METRLRGLTRLHESTANIRGQLVRPGQGKSTLRDLAVAGGPVAFEEPLHVGRPNIGSRHMLMERINSILDSGWLTNGGGHVEQFESRIRQRLGVKHAIAVCNGTVALTVAMKAMRLHGEVIVPSFNFIAGAHAASWLGLKPIFCDVGATTHNLDPVSAERVVSRNTVAILATHLWGRTCDVESIQDIALRYDLKVIYDASHAFSCSHAGTMVGNFGDAEVFSFHATKFINTFEGGAITTNNDRLAERLRLMRNFGFEGPDSVVGLGINGKMSEISAAMGATSMDSIDHFITVNRQNHAAYGAGVATIDGVSLLPFDDRERNNYQYVVLVIDEHLAGLTRDELVMVLQAEGILARRYFSPGNHRMEPYASQMIDSAMRLSVTEDLANTVLCLPNGTSVSMQDVSRVCDVIRLATINADVVRRILRRRKDS